MVITSCKLNHLIDPLGYSLPHCVFSWIVEESQGTQQTTARIVLCQGTEIVTDTGWAVLDSLATHLDISLLPRTRYHWTVSVRTDAGEEATSSANWFETGKMEEAWVGRWIGCDDSEPRHPIFSKAISPDKPVLSARLYICGLGLYEPRWNGEKIGNEYLTPYCNNYNSWLQYQTYDVTQHLSAPGSLSIELGNGWYKGRFGFDNRAGGGYYGDSWKLMAELHVTYTDGSEDVIGTDESWIVTRSTIFFSNIYDGEHRDDTLPDVIPFNAVYVEPPKGVLTARYSTPVTCQQEIPVKEFIHTPAGESVFDIGQNITGSFRLAVNEPAGSMIHLQFGEILQQGNFYRDNLRTAKAEYIYISDGMPHIIEPKFTFYGFRYVKVTGISRLRPEDFTAIVLHSWLPETGRIVTGNPLVNQLLHNVAWGQKGNFLDVPTDCPQRDERMGWTGDAQVFAATACYLHDSHAFFHKYLRDIASEQADMNGMVPIVVPGFGHTSCSAAWSDAACVIPWTLYQMYGDPSILAQQYDSMKSWVEYVTSLEGQDHAWQKQFHFGDWLALDGPEGTNGMTGGTDTSLIASVYFRRSALLTAKAATVLGLTEDAKKYNSLADSILEAIQFEFFTPTGRCAVPTQTGHLLAYCDGLNPNRQRAAKDLIDKLNCSRGMLQTGFVGTPMLCPALLQAGAEDMAFDLLLNEGYPGWLYAVKMGATTIWERWNSVLPDGSISGTGMNSLNHYSYGSIAQWIYQDVAGIAPLEPGFRKARLAPHLHQELKHLDLHFQSAAGLWETHWGLNDDGTISYRCRVPFGCCASLELPYGGPTEELTPGAYSFHYQPNKNLRATVSTYTPIHDLMTKPKVREALLRAVPDFAQIPPSMQSLSIRQLMSHVGSAEDASSMLDSLDAMLASL